MIHGQNVAYWTLPSSPKPCPGGGGGWLFCGTPVCQEEAGEPWADGPCGVGDRWGESGGAQRQERTGGPLRPQRLDLLLPLLKRPEPSLLKPGLTLATRCSPYSQNCSYSHACEMWHFAGGWGDDLTRKMAGGGGHPTSPSPLTQLGHSRPSCRLRPAPRQPRPDSRPWLRRPCPLLAAGAWGRGSPRPGPSHAPRPPFVSVPPARPPAAGRRLPSRGTRGSAAAAEFPGRGKDDDAERTGRVAGRSA